MIRTALTIAGSDPGGSAGIQADLKTFLDHQLYGVAVITGLIAHNTRGVLAPEPVRPAFIAEQIVAVLDPLLFAIDDTPIGSRLAGLAALVDRALGHPERTAVYPPHR